MSESLDQAARRARNGDAFFRASLFPSLREVVTVDGLATAAEASECAPSSQDSALIQ